MQAVRSSGLIVLDVYMQIAPFHNSLIHRNKSLQAGWIQHYTGIAISKKSLLGLEGGDPDVIPVYTCMGF